MLGDKSRVSDLLDRTFNIGAREILKSDIARMFYSICLQFNLVRNPYYINLYQFATNNSIAGFVPPSYNAPKPTSL